MDLHLSYVTKALEGRQYLIGSELAGADIQLTFSLQAAARSNFLDSYSDLKAYIARMESRDAYQRGIEKGGPFTLQFGG